MQLLFSLLILFSFWIHADEGLVYPQNFITSVPQENKNNVESSLEHYQAALSPECEPLAIVRECVNVITGQFFQMEKDLEGTTIDPLHFIRYYDNQSRYESSMGLGFGSNFPFLASNIEEGSRHHYGLISTRENAYLLYRDKEAGPAKVCSIEPHLFEKGYTNSSQMNGKRNFINWKAIFRFKNRQPEWFLQLGDGTKRYYSIPVKLDKFFRSKVGCLTETAYLLEKEIKPNGNVLFYDYTHVGGKPLLKGIKTRNRTDSATLNQLNFHYHKDGYTVEDACGNQVTYRSKQELLPHSTGLGIRNLLKTLLFEVNSSQRIEPTRYGMKSLLWSVNRIENGNQSIRIAYDNQGRVISLFGRQKSLNEELLNRFEYHSGSTVVFDALNQKTVYYFDGHQRIQRICYFDLSGNVVKEESFDWSEKGWLKAKAIGIGEQLSFLKTYQYDSFGNITNETLYGNLTGEKPETFHVSDKEEMDSYAISYRYSTDGFNLLKEKKTDAGISQIYNYLEGTNLCTKILCYYDGRIQERNFRSYDENGEVASIIEDNGSSDDVRDLNQVTYRNLRTIESIQEKGASFGKPWKIKEHYVDLATKQPIFLKETIYTYDDLGQEKEKTIIDSKGNRYASSKQYNPYLQLESETNALNQRKEYHYDQAGNIIQEELVGSGKKETFSYDFANRLIEKNEAIILETAVQGDKVMQDFELESLTIGGEHSQKVKAPPIVSDYGSKDPRQFIAFNCRF